MNQRNSKKPSTNTSGSVGVYATPNGKWRARVRDHSGKTLSLGTFKNISDAIIARKKAEKIYGYHKNNGR